MMRGEMPEEWARAEREAQELPIEDLVVLLRSVLGVRLVAYIGGVGSSRYVTAWADGRELPTPDTQRRLRTALHAAGILQQRWGPVTIHSWFVGMNPLLGDESPARMIRGGRSEDDREIIVAAKAAMVE